MNLVNPLSTFNLFKWDTPCTDAMSVRPAHRLAMSYTQRINSQNDAGQVATVLLGIYRDITAALEPILGSEGVSALFDRSLHRTALNYPWLAGAIQALQSGTGLAALQPLFAQQDAAQATSGALAFLDAFYSLLGSLIGLSLTDQLLRSVGNSPFNNFPAQKTSP